MIYIQQLDSTLQKIYPVLLSCILFIAFAPVCLAGDTPSFRKMLDQAMEGGIYSVPSLEEVKKAEELFALTLSGRPDQELNDAWAALGWEYRRIESEGRGPIFIRETEERKSGRGFFVFFRGGELTDQALMVPHGFKDLLTDEIGATLFSEGGFCCAAFNTRPRRVNRDGKVVGQDLAREERSYFAAFTKAFARHAPTGKIIQLHGFAREKRRTEAGSQAGFILSSGTETAHKNVVALSRCLGQSFETAAPVYPDQVRELGATANITGKILRAMGHNGFIHVEMSRPVREKLYKRKPFREKFLQCTVQLE